MKTIEGKTHSRYLDYLRQVYGQFRIICRDWMGKLGICIILFFIVIAIFAPVICPNGPFKMYKDANGRFKIMETPSLTHWFGTTQSARDVLSQTVWGTRVALIVGIISAFCVTFIGTNIGIISGYYGGKIDDILMRIADIAYGIPFLPLCMLLVALLEPNIFRNSLICCRIAFWTMTSRAVVGSSAIMIEGFRARAIAIMVR